MPLELSQDRKARRVLVIDDDPAILELTSTLLVQAGCIVETADNGYDGLEAIRMFRPEVLILDLNMPGMDGFTVLDHMRRQGFLPTVRTLVFTARTNRDDVDRAVALGARDYLTKPYEPRQLLLRVARLLVKDRAALP
jgi:DNA-binding response OmpR family regulator